MDSNKIMEFIMTYGWAIIVVLVAIAALTYFGVLGEFYNTLYGNNELKSKAAENCGRCICGG